MWNNLSWTLRQSRHRRVRDERDSPQMVDFHSNYHSRQWDKDWMIATVLRSSFKERVFKGHKHNSHIPDIPISWGHQEISLQSLSTSTRRECYKPTELSFILIHPQISEFSFRYFPLLMTNSMIYSLWRSLSWCMHLYSCISIMLTLNITST